MNHFSFCLEIHTKIPNGFVSFSRREMTCPHKPFVRMQKPEQAYGES